MFIDVEETLGRELREVADNLQIPALPPLPQKPPRAPWQWARPLVAAALVLVVAGAVAVLVTGRDGQDPDPAPPAPRPTKSSASIPTTAPTVPYVLEQRLHVDGVRVPGSWWSVRSGDNGWLAIRADYTWWWGRGPQATAVTGGADVPPVISPNGSYIAEIRVENGEGVLTGVDTASGTELGSVPIALGDPQDGSTVSVRAVTDDGRVIAQGGSTGLLWQPLADPETVDLSVTAPGQVILSGTSAGLVVTDGEGGEPYLAEVSEAGRITRIGPVPAHDDVVVSPGAEWLAWTPIGTTGGEISPIPELEAQTVEGAQQTTLAAPKGWGFRVREWRWEDDEHLVSPVVRGQRERMARCSVQRARCVLIDGG